MTWTNLSPAAHPPALVGAVAAYDADNQTIVLFGGQQANGALSNRTWIWNGTTWSEEALPAIQPRKLASMAFDPYLHQLILFGGEGARGALYDDTWAWNGESWTPLDPYPTPGARAGATMSYSPSGDLLLFGGFAAGHRKQSRATDAPSARGRTSPSARAGGVPSLASTSTTPTSSTSSTNTTGTTSPTTTRTTTSTAPTASTAGRTLGDEGPSYVPKPVAGFRTLSDTWAWNGSSWASLSSEKGPSPRAEASSTFDQSSGDTVLYGGASTVSTAGVAGGPLSDTWAWNGKAWHRARTRRSPGPRFAAVLNWDPPAGTVILFGGAGRNGPLGGTWSWSSNVWRPVRAHGSPLPRYGAASAFADDTAQVVIFGGAGVENFHDTDALAVTNPVSSPTTTIPPASTSTTASPGKRPGGSSPTTVKPGKGGGPVKGTGKLDTDASTSGRGGLVNVDGRGFEPGSAVRILFDSAPVLVGQTRAGPDGSFSVSVAIPVGATYGMHHLEAIGEGPAGRMVLSADIMVGAQGKGGLSSGTVQKLVMIGIALAIPLVTWLLASLLAWRRRRVA